jgi:hypothetical protein
LGGRDQLESLICRNQKQTVAEVVENNILQIDFRRAFGEQELEEWEEFVEIVEQI